MKLKEIIMFTLAMDSHGLIKYTSQILNISSIWILECPWAFY